MFLKLLSVPRRVQGSLSQLLLLPSLEQPSPPLPPLDLLFLRSRREQRHTVTNSWEELCRVPRELPRVLELHPCNINQHLRKLDA